MEKDEMKRILMTLASKVEEVQLPLNVLKDLYIPYEAREIMIDGEYFENFKTVGFTENIRSACECGQLTQREMPNGNGVYVSEESIKKWAVYLNVLAEMQYEKVEELISNYDDFAPVANLLRERAGVAVQACKETLTSIEAYIDEERTTPFKNNWKTFSHSLSGLCQSIEAYLKTGNYASQVRENDLEVSVNNAISIARNLSRNLKSLGYAYGTDSVNQDKLNEFEENLWYAYSKINSVNAEIVDAKIGYDLRECFELLTKTLMNMNRFASAD